MLLHEFVDYHAERVPGAEFASDGVRTLSYEEAARTVAALASSLRHAGLGSQTRTAVLSPNSIEFVLLYLAASRAGTSLVPLNTRLAPAEWAAILEDARPGALFCAGELLEFVDPALSGLLELGTELRRVVIDEPSSRGWEAMRDWIDRGRRLPPAPRAPDGVLYHMYTSGTTGRPKGAVLSQQAVTANIVQIRRALNSVSPTRSLVVVPMFHAAIVPSVFVPLACGASLYVLDRFEPARVVRVLERETISFVVLVPTMLRACLRELAGRKRAFPSLRTIYYGGSPISEDTFRAAVDRFACAFVQSYGLTEATQAVTFLDPVDHRRALEGRSALLRSAGRPAARCEVRVVDEQGVVVPHGTSGELVVRGPQIMSGYWQRPDATRETLRNGWLHTGDLGWLDEHGHAFLQDRLDDKIVSGGENIYPSVVERALASHPSVAEAAVVGVPDGVWGETVAAFVVPTTGERPGVAELLGHCEARIAGFARPRSIQFMDELPRNPTGKVLRRVLREPYWQDDSRRVTGS